MTTSKLPPLSPDTINWDPDSDSIFYNAMMETEAVDDRVYLHLDLDESFLTRYIKRHDDHKFGINRRMMRFMLAQNWSN